MKITDITETTTKFKVNLLNDYHREILDTYIKINDKDYKVVDGEVNVTGLRKTEITIGVYVLKILVEKI